MRTLEAPGVEINEIDLSLRASQPVGTKVLVHGFASQGPTNELINVTTKEELDQIFFGGAGPTNPAENYFYHSCKELLNSPATMYVTRFPYGTGDGTGFNGEYTALAYPMSGNGATHATSTAFQILSPVVVPMTEANYFDLQSGGISWGTNYDGTSATAITDFATISNAGFVIINDSKTTIDEKYEGYYLVIADNSIINVSSVQYDAISAINTLNSSNAVTVLQTNLLGFTLTGTDTTNLGNISEIVETAPSFNFGDTYYNDSLIMYLFRLRTSETASDPNKLYYTPVEKFIGSLESNDTRTNANGQPESFYMANLVNQNSAYLKMIVNSNIANMATITSLYNTSRTLNPVGSYTPCKSAGSDLKYVGNIPSKIERALTLAENVQDLDVDIVVGAGLETIWAYTAATSNGAATFDDTANVSTQITALGHPDTGTSSAYKGYHSTIFNLYNNFCQQTRKDCIHISDPIRGIFVQGPSSKTLDNKSKNFTQHVYNPLKNLYSAANSNYSATYANWISVYDNTAGKFIWLPFSGWQAAIMARMDANLQPWYAPMGLNNGIIRNITDIAVKPNQKQQGSLYRIGVNPVVFFQGDGYTVWGQKTLQAKPSAFDRINVRRLFLTLERATLKVMRYFVGEPNTVFTRSRVNNVLTPIFNIAKNNEGCYDYLIVCDERNNTAQVIDNNEMKVDIYIKPVRTAEYILVTFYATRTDQDFNELVG
jgi:phage tail sheath protein FI